MQSPPVHRDDADETTVDEALLAAYRALHDGRIEECLDTIPRTEASAGPLASTVVAVGRALRARARGDTETAARLVERAHEFRAPCAVLLRHCAAHLRDGAPGERAYEAHCLLAQFDREAFNAYWPLLDEHGRYRYAAWAPDPQAAWKALAGCASPAATVLLSESVVPGADVQQDGTSALKRACEAIAINQPESALDWAKQTPDAGCCVAEGIRLVALGLMAARDGKVADADRLMDAAWRLGNPVPAMLRAIGDHFRLREPGDFRAFECYSLLERIAPGTTLPFWQGLPARERLRYAPYLLRVNLLARRPHMYGLRRHKEMVARRFGKAGLAILLSEMRDGRPPAGLRRLPLRSLHDYAREEGDDYDVIGSPRHVSLGLPRILGAGTQARIEGESRTFFRCVLKEAVVYGKSNLVEVPGALLMDFQGTEFEQLPAHLDFNFPVLDDGRDTATIEARRQGVMSMPEALSLTGAQTSNFGHWTMEHMFQLWACMRQRDFETVPILIDAQMPAQHREAIEFFAGPRHRIVRLAMGEGCLVDRLWTCSKVVYWPGGEKAAPAGVARRLAELADPDLMARMLRELQPELDRAKVEGAEPVKLYLTRGSGQSRPMHGRGEVERFFEQRGFTVVNPADLTFVGQLAYLRRATTVVLEAGSSVFSLLYCRPGVRIGYFPVVEVPELECIHEVLLRLGHKMLALGARASPPENSPLVDTDMLARLLDEMELL